MESGEKEGHTLAWLCLIGMPTVGGLQDSVLFLNASAATEMIDGWMDRWNG